MERNHPIAPRLARLGEMGHEQARRLGEGNGESSSRSMHGPPGRTPPIIGPIQQHSSRSVHRQPLG